MGQKVGGAGINRYPSGLSQLALLKSPAEYADWSQTHFDRRFRIIARIAQGHRSRGWGIT